MRIIFDTQGRATGTATDDYAGPDAWADAPEGFDPERLDEYTLADGVVVLVPSSRITRLAFRNRFTMPEKVALELASADNPAGLLAERQQAATLRAYLADVAAATYIDLQRADTRAGVQALEAWGLIGSGRALAILDAPIQPDERPR